MSPISWCCEIWRHSGQKTVSLASPLVIGRKVGFKRRKNAMESDRMIAYSQAATGRRASGKMLTKNSDQDRALYLSELRRLP